MFEDLDFESDAFIEELHLPLLPGRPVLPMASPALSVNISPNAFKMQQSIT